MVIGERLKAWKMQALLMRRVLLSLSVLGVTVGVPAVTYAQNPADNDIDSKGLHRERNYFSPEPWEHFDPVTGNVVLTFADLVLPGNAGQSLVFQRTYNNQLPRSTVVPTWPRWRFGFPGIAMSVVEPVVPGNFDFMNNSLVQILEVSPTLMMSDGSRQLTLFTQAPNAGSPSSLRYARAVNFYTYDRVAHTVTMPNGVVCYYQPAGTDPSSGDPLYVLREIADPFGNSVQLIRDTPGQVLVRQWLGEQTREVLLALDATGQVREMTYDDRVWTYTFEDTVGGGVISQK
jgi:hypothetical protein